MRAVKKVIQLICEKIADVQAIYFFGSAAVNLATSESDIDLAVLAGQKLEPNQLWQVAQALASLLNKEVDLIDLWQASTVMRWQVVNTGQRLYCKDKSICDAFENTAFSAYIRFNDERREIIEEIQKRGSVL